jgi:putative tricarboxylic transport membrane protein
MYIGNIMLLILNLPLVGVFARIAVVPQKILMPIVLVFCFLGAFAVRNSIFDLYLLIIFGVVGYIFRLKEYDPSPLALGMIVGPMLENYFRQSMVMLGGDYLGFFSQPLSGLLLSGTILFSLYPAFRRLLKIKKAFS